MPHLTETILRDAHQSLMATRLRTHDMLLGAELLDHVGYASVEIWGGATFDVCLRFLNEDPWERLRLLKARLRQTPAQMLLRGQNLVGYEHYPDDVVDLFVETAARNGIDIFRVFDALNDVRNMERAISAVRRAGRHAQGTICFTRSPVHTLHHFKQTARSLKDLGCQSLCLKDMAGLLNPVEAAEWVRETAKDLALPLHIHTHNAAGYAMAAYWSAAQAGAFGLDTALSPLANGVSQPATESVVAAFAGTPWDTGLRLAALEPITRHFLSIREKYAALIDPRSERVDARVAQYQVPGGMFSNLVHQLKGQNKLHLFDDVLVEIPRVRADLGWPPLVTPTSQIIGCQAALNVISGERYRTISTQVRALALGYYGRTPAPVNPELLARLTEQGEPIRDRPADHLPPRCPDLRERHADLIRSDEDLLTLALFPEVGERFLRGEVSQEPHPLTLMSGPFRSSVPRWPVRPEARTHSPGMPLPETAGNGKAPVRISIRPVPDGKGGEPRKPHDAPEDHLVRSPMQGTLIRLRVRPGDDVRVGETLVVLEAMKMENDVVSPMSGTVIRLLVGPGQVVHAEQPLLEISPNP